MAKRNRTPKTTTPEVTAPEVLDQEVDLQPTDAAAPEAAAPTDEATEQVVAELRTRRAALMAELAALDGQLSQYQNHVLDTSVVQKPVHLCRQVFVAMYGQRRRDVVAALINKGVAANTAKTQFQVLKKKVDNGDEELLAEVEAAAQPAN